MVECPNCGRPARPKARFCPNCGERLPTLVESSPPVSGTRGTDPGATLRRPRPPVSPPSRPVDDDLPPTIRVQPLPGGPPLVAVPSEAPPRTRHKWYRPGIPSLAVVGAVAVLGCVLAAYTTSQAHASTDWYIVRATGFVAYGLLTVSVLLGLVVATRWHAFTGPWLVFERLHPLVLLAAGLLLAFHIATLILLSFPVLQALVPFISAFDPTPVALGILALYLMIVLLVSTYLIGSIGYRTWHRMHYAGLAAWLLALLHGLLVGNDSGEVWARALYYASAVLVAALLLVYLLGRLQAARRRSAPSASTGAAR